MSSCFSRSSVSGPLVTGQTRISSSFGSTEGLHDAAYERRIDVRTDGQKPAALVRERLAFYRILLGHQDYSRPWQRKVAARKAMVIRKRVGRRRDTERTQVSEESLGI